MSNAIQIARRLKLSESLLQRAEVSLNQSKGDLPVLTQLQQLREDAEKAKLAALAAQHEAETKKSEYERKIASEFREAEAEAELHEQRRALQPNMVVHVARFDKKGKVVRVDTKKETVIVSLGLGQWEVPFSEVTPD